MPVPVYRYLAYDLLTGILLEELPLRDVSFELRLNGAGAFSATMPTGFRTRSGVSLNRIYLGATEPLQTALYVERDGVLVWGGWIIGRGRSSENGTITLAGADFFSFLNRQTIETTFTFTVGVDDQFDIVRALVDWLQAQGGGNIALAVTAGDSGVTRDRTYYGYEAKNLGEAISQLAAVADGFDFAVDVGYSSGFPTKTLSLHYPSRGRALADTGHVFETGRNILTYDWPEDGARTANRVIALGAGDGIDMLTTVAARTDLIDLGYPRLSSVLSLKDVSVASTLAGHAQAEVDAYGLPTVAPTVTVQAGAEPSVGSWIVGDQARIRIEDDDLFPAQADGSAGLDVVRRIVAATIRPGEAGDTATLTFAEI